MIREYIENIVKLANVNRDIEIKEYIDRTFEEKIDKYNASLLKQKIKADTIEMNNFIRAIKYDKYSLDMHFGKDYHKRNNYNQIDLEYKNGNTTITKDFLEYKDSDALDLLLQYDIIRENLKIEIEEMEKCI